MTAKESGPAYALGHADAEHERLIRQAAHLAPCTERFFRQAGIGPGQRVVDLGSGVGDVAMLAARLVGPSGEVVGIERDARSVARARTRVAEAGLHNVSFTEADVSEFTCDKPFDAAIGRFILQFLPAPADTLRALLRLIRPGGVLAFQEPSWAPLFPLSSHLPLWSACAKLTHQVLEHSGANTEMGPALYRLFQEAGLSAPYLLMEIPLGRDPESARWIYELFYTLLPQVQRLNLSTAGLGDLGTLAVRMQAEVRESNTVVPCFALVGAWSFRQR
jgi:ubiquinone/menaquinone biosynthesis C-methylase UbiE